MASLSSEVLGRDSIMEKQVLADYNSVRTMFAGADYVEPLTVFNIGGNKYRLIAAIHYDRGKDEKKIPTRGDFPQSRARGAA